MTVAMVKNPDKMGYGRNQLIQCFGANSRYKSSLTIIRIQQNRADLKMETCAGDLLYFCQINTEIYSTGLKVCLSFSCSVIYFW